MHIEKNIVNRITQAGRRYAKFQEAFASFIKGAEYFSNPQGEIKGVELVVPQGLGYFDVKLATIQIRFHFTICYAADDSLRGKVVCVLQPQPFSDTKKILGSFTFNGQGETDFEVPVGEDKIELNYSAIEIVSHFLEQGIRQQAGD